MSDTAQDEQSLREADALRDPYFPEVGEIVEDRARDDGFAVVVGRIKQPAGKMVMGGRTLAEVLAVREDRVCVWTVLAEHLSKCHWEIGTAADALDAVRADAVYPTPAGVTMIAPTDVEDITEVLD